MGLHHSFGVLSEIIASYESDGGSVRAVETTSEPNGVLRAGLTVPVDCCSAGERDGRSPAPASATLTPDGGLRVKYSPSDLAKLTPPVADAVTSIEREASVTAAGELVMSIDLRIEPREGGGSAEASSGHESEADRMGDSRSDLPSETRSDRTGEATDHSTGQNNVGGRAASSSTAGSPGETDLGGAGETDVEGAGQTSAGCPTPDSDGEGSDDRDDASDPLAAARDSSVPPFEDADYLRRLYERCDTFAEMGRRIEMDVSAETVRRYMTDAGVHQPERYGERGAEAGPGEGSEHSTEPAAATEAGERGIEPAAATEAGEHGTEPGLANDGGAEGGTAILEAGSDGEATADGDTSVTPDSAAGPDEPADLPPDEHLVADGLGLPADLDLRDVVEAVVDARCLYDVTRSLDLDQDRTRELLVQLNLLDLVSHRLSTVRGAETSFEDVAARIRQCTPEAT